MSTLSIQDTIDKHLPSDLHRKLLYAQADMGADGAGVVENGVRNAEAIQRTLGMAEGGSGNSQVVGDADTVTLNRMCDYVGGIVAAGRERASELRAKGRV